MKTGSAIHNMSLWSLVIVALTAMAILYVGLHTDISLGDESYHFRFAKTIYQMGHRPVSDPVFDQVPDLGFDLTDAPLWHFGLAGLWKITGGISPVSAQLYHILYFLLLSAALFFFSKALYNDNYAAFCSILLLVSCPGIILLSLILYLDVPVIAFLVACFLCIYKKHYMFAGVFAGLSLLTKINALLFFPCLSLMILLFSQGLHKKILNLLIFYSISILINLPDMLFRLKEFHYLYYTPPHNMTLVGNASSSSVPYAYSMNSIFLSPVNTVQYIGLLIPLLIAIYVVKKNYSKADLLLWLTIAIYSILCLFLFRNNPDVRYFLPIFPLLILPAARSMSTLKSKSVLVTMFIVSFLQLASTLGFAYEKRCIPKEIFEGFKYIQTNLENNAVLMYPEENIITYTSHPIAWGRIYDLPTLFWQAEDKECLNILTRYHVDYIVIKKNRVYDDSRVHHLSGYPQSFVNKLSKLEFLKTVFDNPELTVLRVQKEI